MCSLEVDSLSHVVRDCIHVKVVWRGMTNTIDSDFFTQINLNVLELGNLLRVYSSFSG